MFKVRTSFASPRSETPSNFYMKFDNGYAISLAMGGGTYSTGDAEDGFTSVEVAVFDPDGNFFPLTEDNDVLGWQSPKQVLEIISRFQSMA